MKIAFLNIYQNRVERGVETFVSEVSSRLSKNYQVKVLAGGKKPQRRWPILWRAFLDPHGVQGFFWTLKLIPKIWRERFDIVIPVNGGWQSALVRFITWLYGGKMVISGQSGKGWDDRNNLWSLPDAFIALSTQAKNWAKKAMPLVKVRYIPNGVDTKKFRKDGPKFKTNLKRPIVLCAGALEPTKRLHLAIKAVAKLKNISLLVAGDGDLKEDIKKLGKELMGDRFSLVKIPFEDMPKAYRAADVFTIPSASYYAFEIVLVEAMASGLPVVANEDPIRREIVGDAGILVDPTNTEEYARVLKRALGIDWDDNPRTQAKKFDWDKIAEKYEELFKKLTK